MINRIRSNILYRRVEARFLLPQPPTKHIKKRTLGDHILIPASFGIKRMNFALYS